MKWRMQVMTAVVAPQLSIDGRGITVQMCCDLTHWSASFDQLKDREAFLKPQMPIGFHFSNTFLQKRGNRINPGNLHFEIESAPLTS